MAEQETKKGASGGGGQGQAGLAARLTEQAAGLFLEDEPPLAAGIAALLGMEDADADLIWDLAVGLHRQGRFAEAEAVFARLCRLQGLAQARNYKGLGAARQRLGRWRDAAAAYEFAALLSRDDPEPAFYAAECLRELGLHDRAREALKASILLADGGGAAYAPLKARAEALLAGAGAEGGRGEEAGA